MSDDLGPGGAVIAGATIRVNDSEFPWQPGTVITVGRDPTCDVVIDNPRVSRRHMSIEATADGAWLLRDLGSRNGVFVAGHKVDSAPLREPVIAHLGAADGAEVAVEVVSADAQQERPGPGEPTRPPPASPDKPAKPPEPTGEQAQPSPARPISVKPGRSVSLYVPSTDVVRIGRQDDNDIVLAGDPRASRRHAELRRLADGGWEVHDLGSHNGTFLNGARTSRARLTDGDLLAVGNHVYVFYDGRLEQFSEADDTSLDAVGVTVTVDRATLLEQVSFSLPSRSVLAVIGPSGAGKSTLLKALTGALTPSQGHVSFAGRDLHASYEEFRSRIGSVPQDDLVHPELTPRTELELAAALRLPPDIGRTGRRERAAQVLRELGLTERADLQISKLSGGQRKRVSVGTELLTEPTLLFLDEPTSGLDPGNEKQVMSVLRQLADGGRIVVVVTHATQSLDLTDRVLFLTRGGRVAYFGPPADAVAFFARHGVGGGYADIFRALDDPGDVDWAAVFRADPDHDRYVGRAVRQAAVRRETAARRPSARTASPVSALDQFRVLVRRQAKIIAGDRRTMLLLAAQPLVFGLVIFVLFQPYTLSTTQGPFAALMLWLIVISATWLGASGTIREVVKELPVYRRERAVGLSIPAYVGSKFAVFGAITVVQSVLLVAIGLGRQPLPPQNTNPRFFVQNVRILGSRVAPSSFRGLRPYELGAVLSSQRLEIVVAVALTGLAGTALGLALSSIVRKSDQAIFLLPVALVVQMALSLPLLQLQNPNPLTQQVGKIISASWGMSAVASTVSLNQLMSAYLWSLAFGQQEVKRIFTGSQTPLIPSGPKLRQALIGSPAWDHFSSSWLTAVFALVVITAVLLGIVVIVLRRQDIGRQGTLARRRGAQR